MKRFIPFYVEFLNGGATKQILLHDSTIPQFHAFTLSRVTRHASRFDNASSKSKAYTKKNQPRREFQRTTSQNLSLIYSNRKKLAQFRIALCLVLATYTSVHFEVKLCCLSGIHNSCLSREYVILNMHFVVHDAHEDSFLSYIQNLQLVIFSSFSKKGRYHRVSLLCPLLLNTWTNLNICIVLHVAQRPEKPNHHAIVRRGIIVAIASSQQKLV